MPDTVLDVLEATARAHASEPAMRRKQGGAWRTTTWREYRDEVRRAARALVALGVEPGAGVVIMGFNRPEWFVANLGAMSAGALPAGIYTTSTPEQSEYVAAHAEAAVAVLENPSYLARFLPAQRRLPKLRAIVLMEGEAREEGVLTWQQFHSRAEAVPEAEVERRLAAARPDDVCTLIYTSGTTGAPKGVMLTHRNLVWIGAQAREFSAIQSTDSLISYLPLAHIAEQAVSLHLSLATGACVSFAESVERLPENLREVRPHAFLGVPRVWEKVQAGIQAAAAQGGPVVRRLGAWARKVGLAGGYAEQQGKAKPCAYGLARRLVFSKVRARLGLDRCRFAIVSAAPVALETLEYFLSLGIPIMEIYGMSEVTGPATVSVPSRYRTGRAGVAIPGTEIRIAADGEILIRGPHVFEGYYKNPEATAETLDADGWVHSGDVGDLDADGFLRVTDRKKELIITSGGKNIAPQHLEGRLKQIAAVSQAVAVGDRRPYVVALLTLDPARVGGEAEKAGSNARTPEEAAACPAFRAWVARQVGDVNASLARYETIKHFALLPRELSVETGELTPTLKLRRSVILEHYRDVIDALYA
jgi:long-subunit acyl-CoA synthetase (AMP-forming)